MGRLSSNEGRSPADDGTATVRDRPDSATKEGRLAEGVLQRDCSMDMTVALSKPMSASTPRFSSARASSFEGYSIDRRAADARYE